MKSINVFDFYRGIYIKHILRGPHSTQIHICSPIYAIFVFTMGCLNVQLNNIKDIFVATKQTLDQTMGHKYKSRLRMFKAS